MSDQSPSTELDDELFDRVRVAIKPGDEITTLSVKRPNRIALSSAPALRLKRCDQIASGLARRLCPHG
jgi:hypothetical protein